MDTKHVTLDLMGCGLSDPQQQLGLALAQSDINSFRLALDMGAEPERLDDKHNSIFEKALKTHGCADYVQECLNRGCNPNYMNVHLNKAAINFATDSRDPLILNCLLRHKSLGTQIDHKYANLTPLNSLAKNLTAENANDVSACMRLLLNHGASPNIPDQREMTPLNHILKNRKIDEQQKRDLVYMFLQQAQNLDIDSYRDGEVRKILSETYTDLQLPHKNSALQVTLASLLTHLNSGNTEKFLELYQEYNETTKVKDELFELFLESIKRYQNAAFEAMLESGVNINQIHNGNSAVELSVIWGNWHALSRLLQQENLKIRTKDELLITAIKKLDEMPLHENCDYNKCLYVLFNSNRVDINEVDASGSTALHYAVKYRNEKAIQELLKRGAYIGIKSKFNDLPIENMSPKILEEHFDNCVSTNGLKPGEQSFEIILNFMNIMRSQKEPKQAHQLLHDEITPIAFMAESKEYNYLLQHPLITSFLFLKWHRLSAVFYINFFCYVLFTISIITHTMLKFHESEYEHVTTLFGLFSWIGIIYLVLREVLQVLLSPVIYFCSFINYMEIALILLSIITCSAATYDLETLRILAVLNILLVALELCLLVGSLPVLSISTHMRMLQAVSSSFLKSFALYSIFVVTFSLCFYILFGKSGLEDDEQSKFNKFSEPFVAITKTIVMLTGEFDAGDIVFDNYYSYMIFLLFVFFMSIVLFNLLNGLAVSDTQAIKAQAELNGSICRANVLARYEEVLTGQGRASFIVNHEPFRSICRRLLNIYPNYIAGRQIAILPNDANKVMIPMENSYEMTTLLKRDEEARNSKTTFLPLGHSENKTKEKRVLDPPVRVLTCCFPCLSGRCAEMNKGTVKQALCVLERKAYAQNEKQRLQNTERRLQSIEQKLGNIFELLKEIQAK